MTDKRKDQRIKKKLMVSFSEAGFDGLALTDNISESGLCISSGNELSTHNEIELSIAVPGEIFHLKGRVMWCKESGDKQDAVPDDIGIKITDAPPEYINYIEFIKRHGVKNDKSNS